MRNGLLLTILVSLLIMSAGTASARPISVFGGFGYGTITSDQFGTEGLDGGLAIQVGALYSLTDEFAVGVMLDRLTSSQKEVFDPSHKVEGVATLTGYDGVAHYTMADAAVKIGVFGGLGLYNMQMKVTETFQGATLSATTNTESTLGFVAGTQLSYAINPEMYVAGNLAYRSTSFSKMSVGGITETLPENLNISGLSFGLGVGYEF